MHPAPSVILFTTLSGFGFGLLAFLGLGFAGPPMGAAAFGWYALGYAGAVGGLLLSVTHLANPRNAIKAFSQWQSSWLSREGIAAIAALLVSAPVALARIFWDTDLPVLGWLAAALALITVVTTAMIYAQLRSVPRWNSAWTPAIFILHFLAGGAIAVGPPGLALTLLIALGAVQLGAWAAGDEKERAPSSTMESATGLGRIGKVRAFEPPHQGDNYLLKEMAYSIGRKHARKLRIIGLGLAVVLPALLLVALPPSLPIRLAALASHIAGTAATRWLFFAEARHVMALYYGR